jgi:hypothetical protein
MKVYRLKVKEHEEYGLGLVVDVGRPYFEPLQGLSIAHDVLEHTIKPHPNPYIDELMALGGLIAGRVETGWCSQYGRWSRVSDIAADVEVLASGCINSGKYLEWGGCKAHLLHNTHLKDDIRDAVLKGIKDAEYECEESIDCDIDSTTAWIIKGYQAYKKRFRRLGNYGVANTIFNSIATCCDNLLKQANDGETYSLHVDFKGYNAFITNDYGEHM